MRLRLAVCVAAVATVAVASMLGGALTLRLAPATAASGGCSKATAVQVVERLQLGDSGIPNRSDRVGQVLCGAFVGPGSQAMVVAIANGTCWPNSGWAVFRFTGGAWQLVPNGYHSGFVAALAAVGSDIRETVPIWRKGDGICFPNGGTKARFWRWNGSRFAAGPWKQVTKGEPEARGFDSPSLNIGCGMFDDSSFSQVVCQSRVPPQKVIMTATGRLNVCRDRTPNDGNNDCNLGDRGEGPIRRLAYGKQITVGRFRCLSLEIGVRCTVIQSGKGFLINRDGVSRIGP
jgi:hypothetical protein